MSKRRLEGSFEMGLRHASRAQSLLRTSGLLLCSVALAACADHRPTVIDGSSPEAFERTAAEARRDIPDADRLYFDRALRTVGGRRHSERDQDKLARVTFDGMTARQVVAEQKAQEGAEKR